MRGTGKLKLTRGSMSFQSASSCRAAVAYLGWRHGMQVVA